MFNSDIPLTTLDRQSDHVHFQSSLPDYNIVMVERMKADYSSLAVPLPYPSFVLSGEINVRIYHCNLANLLLYITRPNVVLLSRLTGSFTVYT